jgi:hypothetical protein
MPTTQAVPLESVPAESRTGDCAARKAGYVCTLTPGHGGTVHVSHGTEAAIIWARECTRFDWDAWSDVAINEQQCRQCGKRERDHAGTR